MLAGCQSGSWHSGQDTQGLQGRNNRRRHIVAVTERGCDNKHGVWVADVIQRTRVN
jgi:hypothetical protein